MGWFYDDVPFEKTNTIERNMTLTAKWSPKDCKVVLYIDDENPIEVNYVYDTLVKDIETIKEEFNKKTEGAMPHITFTRDSQKMLLATFEWLKGI